MAEMLPQFIDLVSPCLTQSREIICLPNHGQSPTTRCFNQVKVVVMIFRCIALAIPCLAIFSVIATTSISLAETTVTEPPAQVSNPVDDKQGVEPSSTSDTAKPIEKNTAAPAEKQIEKTQFISQPATVVAPTYNPTRPPVYIEDWGRLAELTQADPQIFEKAEFWAKQHDNARVVLASGIILGGGAIALGTVDRLTSDQWTETTKWSVAGGVGAIVLSLFTAWAFSPDRDDLLTVINHWNLRHPDRPLAP